MEFGVGKCVTAKSLQPDYRLNFIGFLKSQQ